MVTVADKTHSTNKMCTSLGTASRAEAWLGGGLGLKEMLDRRFRMVTPMLLVSDEEKQQQNTKKEACHDRSKENSTPTHMTFQIL